LVQRVSCILAQDCTVHTAHCAQSVQIV